MNYIKLFEEFSINEMAKVLSIEEIKSKITKLITNKANILEQLKKVNRFKPSHFEKQTIRRLQSENDKIDREIDSYIYHTAEVKAALSQLDIPAQKSSSTSIRGFRNYSTGYSIGTDDKSLVDIKGYKDKINDLSDILKKQGIENTLNGSYINIKPNSTLLNLKNDLIKTHINN